MICLAGRKIKMASKMVDYRDSAYGSDEQYGVGNSFDLEDTLRILKEEIRSCMVDKIESYRHTRS